MAIFEFNGTLASGASTRWWTGGSGWYTHGQLVQLDAHPLNPGSQLVYYDFGSTLGNDGFWTYYVSVRNIGPSIVNYHMRVWVP